MYRRLARSLGLAVVLLAAWTALAALSEPTTLPSPVRVGARLAELIAAGGVRDRTPLFHLWRSLLRVAVVSTIALGLATALGLAMAFDDRVEAVVGTWLPVWMTVPTLVVVLVAMVLFDFGEAAVVAGVTFAATPFAAANVWEGAGTIDPDLLEMVRAFDAGRRLIVREVYLPATLPFVVGSFRYLFGMVWKIVVLAETFGLSTGLGTAIRFWFNQGDVTAVLAYLVLFLAVMLAVQYGLRALEERLFAWRG